MLRANPTGRGYKGQYKNIPEPSVSRLGTFFSYHVLLPVAVPIREGKRREDNTSLFCAWVVFVWHTLPGKLCFQISDRSQPFVKRTPQTFFLRPSQWQRAFNPSTHLLHSSSPPNLPHA